VGTAHHLGSKQFDRGFDRRKILVGSVYQDFDVTPPCYFSLFELLKSKI
jgi:hypothetical protein